MELCMLLEWSGTTGRATTTLWRASAWRSVRCSRAPGPCYSRTSSADVCLISGCDEYVDVKSKWECECVRAAAGGEKWFSAGSDVPFSLLRQLNTLSFTVRLRSFNTTSGGGLNHDLLHAEINEKQTQSWCDGCLHCVSCVFLSDSLSVRPVHKLRWWGLAALSWSHWLTTAASSSWAESDMWTLRTVTGINTADGDHRQSDVIHSCGPKLTYTWNEHVHPGSLEFQSSLKTFNQIWDFIEAPDCHDILNMFFTSGCKRFTSTVTQQMLTVEREDLESDALWRLILQSQHKLSDNIMKSVMKVQNHSMIGNFYRKRISISISIGNTGSVITFYRIDTKICSIARP